MRRTDQGYTLIEILLVLALIGILSAIAIPSYWGAKSNAKYAGDAKANASVIMMALEGYRAEHGLFPPGGPFKWVQGAPPTPNPLPTVSFKSGTTLDFTLTVANDQLSYVLEATDPANANKSIYKVDQTGQLLP